MLRTPLPTPTPSQHALEAVPRVCRLPHSAIRSLGLIDSDPATAALLEIYGQSSDTETREAIIKALFLSDDAAELIQIARTESDPQLRKSAFHRLSLMDDEAAVDFMMEILEQ